MAALAHDDDQQLNTSSVVFCEDIQDWPRLAGGDGVQGMCVNRPLDPVRFQAVADALAADEQLGSTQEVRVNVWRSEFASSPKDAFQNTAAKIIKPLSHVPDDLRDLIVSDAGAMGEQLAELLPDAEKFSVALDLMGANVCKRWHMDNYLGRAIVSYNLSGTEYTDASNVDMWELKNCGMCEDRLLFDTEKTGQVRVGHILFMKGSAFPPGDRPGLVHKSPAPVCDSEGRVVHRLCLKVDAPRPEAHWW